jgi:hypothetical protein
MVQLSNGQAAVSHAASQLGFYRLPSADGKDESPKMVVRNTFIDFEDASAKMVLERSSSAPANHSASVICVATLASFRARGGPCVSEILAASVKLETTDLTRTTTHDHFEGGAVEEGLMRTRTFDPFEQCEPWPIAMAACAPEWVAEPFVAPCALELAPQRRSIDDSSEHTDSCEAATRKSSGVSQRQPQTLTHNVAPHSDIISICWCVDAKKLKSNDRVAVSPPFGICGVFNFKLMLYALTSSCSKGGTSFRKSKGWGIIQLKCEAQPDAFPADSFSFHFLIGRSEEDCRLRLPHKAKELPMPNFARCGVAGLARENAEWDFNEAIDDQSQTFTVCLGIIPHRR